ncbi:MAG: HD family hydrolase [Pseudomonadota bacterium]
MVAEGRAWQRMLSGRRLDLLDPSPLDIEIEDIAHGLARVARWNGQTHGDHIFSVAQHSVLVAEIYALMNTTATKTDVRAVLLHDAAEYVIGDMISPFKAVIGETYKSVEAQLQSAIHIRFELTANLPPSVTTSIKAADRVAAYYEATRLAGFAETEARAFFGAPPPVVALKSEALDLTPLPAEGAKTEFLNAFHKTNTG